jgi:putative ABC transport system ATP-binding protein
MTLEEPCPRQEPAAVEAIALTRVYQIGGRPLLALDHVSLTVAHGEIVAVVGPSGSGKSTLLYVLGGLDQPDGGTVRVTGVEWRMLRGTERARFLRRSCGFIAQGLALLPQATAAENVEIPLLLDRVEPGERRRRVAEALERVGLAAHATKLTDQLSGGQQQRVSIARALVHEPAVVLADEPTGNLDSVTAQDITRLLVAAASEHGSAVVLVTHDSAVARHADRILTLQSGRASWVASGEMVQETME